jgi:hypothetical protein
MKKFIFILSVGILLFRCSIATEPENQNRVQFDTRLIGRWTNTETYNSGDFWYVITQTIVITANEEMNIYEPTSYASTSTSSISSSSQGKLLYTLQVITRGNKIFAIHSETREEVYIAKYEIDGNSMLTVSAEGVKELWTKG